MTLSNTLQSLGSLDCPAPSTRFFSVHTTRCRLVRSCEDAPWTASIRVAPIFPIQKMLDDPLLHPQIRLDEDMGLRRSLLQSFTPSRLCDLIFGSLEFVPASDVESGTSRSGLFQA